MVIDQLLLLRELVSPIFESDFNTLSHRSLTSSNFPALVTTGKTESFSFLHFLQQIVRPYVGSVPFTDGEHRHDRFEAAISDERSGRVDISAAQMYSLLDFYFEGVSIHSHGVTGP